MGKVVVEVCAGTHCSMMGSMDIVSAIESLVELKESGIDCDVDIQMTPCLGVCQRGALSPVVRIDGVLLLQADTETIMSHLLNKSRHCADPENPADPTGPKGR